MAEAGGHTREGRNLLRPGRAAGLRRTRQARPSRAACRPGAQCTRAALGAWRPGVVGTREGRNLLRQGHTQPNPPTTDSRQLTNDKRQTHKQQENRR